MILFYFNFPDLKTQFFWLVGIFFDLMILFYFDFINFGTVFFRLVDVFFPPDDILETIICLVDIVFRADNTFFRSVYIIFSDLGTPFFSQ